MTLEHLRKSKADHDRLQGERAAMGRAAADTFAETATFDSLRKEALHSRFVVAMIDDRVGDLVDDKHEKTNAYCAAYRDRIAAILSDVRRNAGGVA